ncbi:PQQ-binding-like beta-propeller repeat protein [Occultella kanbiaonis]|uniref:outer membrane protein assembly factor BamB family protein n=1 Tax=Occultella kanbiaonis TaxID=2675754 RepID=UPI0013D68486|nr:PQQ-binding-like beta-propeller repeat protein [Occultella kanbiaonis]
MGDHEEFDVGAGVGAFDDGRPMPDRPGSSARRPGWVGWTLAAVALVAGGVLAAPAGSTLGPAPIWGLLSGLQQPPVRAWSADLEFGADGYISEVHLLDDVVLVSVQALDTAQAIDPTVQFGSSSFWAFNADDGALLWTLEEDPLSCGRPQTSLVCVSGSGADVEVLAIDLATGDVGRTPAPHVLAAAELEGDLIVVRADPDGERAIRYRGWATTDERWRRVVGPTAPENSYYRRSIEPWQDQLIISGTRGVVLDTDTGDTLLDNISSYVISDEVLVVQEAEPSQTHFYPLHGEDVMTRPAEAPWLWVDDDPRSDTYLSQRPDSPTVISASTNDVLWTTDIDDPTAHAVARHQGTIIMSTEAAFYGLDAATGEQLWSTRPLASGACATPATASFSPPTARQASWHLRPVPASPAGPSSCQAHP